MKKEKVDPAKFAQFAYAPSPHKDRYMKNNATVEESHEVMIKKDNKEKASGFKSGYVGLVDDNEPRDNTENVTLPPI